MSNQDIFINNKVFQDAKDIFSATVEPVSNVKDDCLFVLDTNALLLPYTTSSRSIDEIKKVYTRLINEKRLFIPGQVAREFAKNRPEKIKELFQQLNRKRDKVKSLYTGQYPLLTGLVVYNEAIAQEQKIDELLKEYSKKVSQVIDEIKAWTWNDPVSQVYNALFNENAIVDPKFDEDAIKKELETRYLHKIPPGYKDEGKSDEGIGDLLIWFTILEIAKTNKKNIVFVSGEEKTDWFYKSDGQVLYPRFELTTEFRQKADKKSFNIVKMSELLELFGADNTVIQEVENEERIIRTVAHKSFFRQRKLIESSVLDWVIENYSASWEIKTNVMSFPTFLLTNSQGEKLGVEVITSRHPEMIEFRFRDVFSRAMVETSEKGINKFMFILVYPNEALVGTIRRALDRMRERYNSASLNFEIILGFLNEKNQFEKI